MRIQVIFNGGLKALVGTQQTEVSFFSSSSSVADLLTHVALKVGVPKSQFDSAAVAVGGAIVSRQHRLSDGDVVQLLPPVSGG